MRHTAPHLRHRAIVLVWLAVVSACLLEATEASADQEAPALYDARSAAMGGTGVAFIDSGAALFHNPANMEMYERTAVTLTFTPAFARVSAPFAGPGTEQDSTRGFAPFFLLGAGYRVHDRIVLGLGAYATGGIGSQFQNVPAVGGENLDLSVALMEISLPVSVRIIDGLSLGLAVRATLAFQNSDVIDPMSGARLEQSQKGVGVPGFTAGIFYQPIDALRLGFTYRSRVNIDLDGTSTLAGMSVSSRSEWWIPHSFKLGTAVTLANDALVLAVDLKFQLYAQSHNQATTILELPPGDTEQTIQLDWNNVFTAQIGGEYRFTELFTLRLGYIVGNSAVPQSTSGPFFPTPGVLQGVTGGVGFDISSFELGLGVVYTFAKEIVSEPSVNGTPGEYEANALTLSITFTYRL
jgi:long-chain fatty acid transport protein